MNKILLSLTVVFFAAGFLASPVLAAVSNSEFIEYQIGEILNIAISPLEEFQIILEPVQDEQLPEELVPQAAEIVKEPIVQEPIILEPLPEPPVLTTEEAQELLLDALLTQEQRDELGRFDSPLEAIQFRIQELV